MLKLLEQVDAATQHRAVPPMTTVSVSFDADAPSMSAPIPDWWKWEIGIEFRQWVEGPEADRIQLLRNARRAIAHEVYGEIEEEIRLALRDLWDEGFHRSKAAERLEKLLPLLRAED